MNEDACSLRRGLFWPVDTLQWGVDFGPFAKTRMNFLQKGVARLKLRLFVMSTVNTSCL